MTTSAYVETNDGVLASETPLLKDKVTFTIYPNPVKDVMNIKLRIAEPMKYEIFNTTGQVLLSGSINNDSSIVDLSHLANGLYAIKVSGESKSQIKKIIKK